jgi:hypothetical protein
VTQVRGELRDRHAAQAVVRAERDHQDANVPGERAIEPRAGVRRRVSRHSGVDDFIRKPGAADALVQQGRIGDGGSDAVAGRQAVAETDDASHVTKHDMANG